MLLLVSRLFLFALPLQFALPVFTEDIPLIRVLALLLVGLFLIEGLSKRRITFPPLFFTASLLSFLFLGLASVVWSIEPSFALRKIVFLWNILPLVFVWWYFSREKLLGALLPALLFGSVLSASFGLIVFASQFIFGVSTVFHFMIDQALPFFLGQDLGTAVARYPSLLVNIDGETWLRATALFPDPHVASYFFGMTGFLALGLFLVQEKKQYAVWAMILFLADILTFSRGGYVGLLAGGLVFLGALFSQGWLFSLRKILVGVFIVGTVGVLFGGEVFSRFLSSFSLADASNTGRIVLWQEATTQILERPLLGTGMGNAIVWARPLADFWTPYYAHNLFLDIGVELGILGLVFFLLIFVTPLRGVCAGLVREPGYSASLLAALALYFSHSIFETTLFSVHVLSLLTFMLILALRSSPERTLDTIERA